MLNITRQQNHSQASTRQAEPMRNSIAVVPAGENTTSGPGAEDL